MRKLMSTLCLVCALAWAAYCGNGATWNAQQGEPTAKAAQAEHYAGIALLASGVGSDYSVDDLVAFVEVARIRHIVIDWAWITAHWDRSKFAEVEKLVKKLKAAKVDVSAMYRPRFFASQAAEIGVKFQVDAEGESGPKREIDYSDEKARKWGTNWAVEILKRCPSFDEVTIYNPMQRSLSAECREQIAKDPKFNTNCVKTFLEETRKAMREVKKDARLGLVSPPVESWYTEMKDVVDVPRPYVFVLPDAKYEKDFDAALACMKTSKTPGPALAKITWDEETRVSDEWLADFIAAAKKKQLRYCFWTYEKAFLSGIYHLDKLCAALGIDAARLKPIVARLGGKAGPAVPKEQIEKELKEAALSEHADGYVKLVRLAEKYGEAAIETLTKLLDDKGQTELVRWRAAGALGATMSPKAVEPLLRNSKDDSVMVRLLCASALGFCGRGSEAARKRLEEMAENDPATMYDTRTGKTIYHIRETAKQSLELLKGSLPEKTPPCTDGRDAFLDAMPWEKTLEAALKRGKEEGRCVLAFVVPVYRERNESGYQGAEKVAATDKRPADDPNLVPETGLVKEQAMLTGLLGDPRVVELLRKRFVIVRMRMSMYHFWFSFQCPHPDPLEKLGTKVRNLGGPSMLFISPQGQLLHSATRLSVFNPALLHRMGRAVLAMAEGPSPAQPAIDEAMDRLGESGKAEDFSALAELLINCGEFAKAAALLEKPPASLQTRARLWRAEMALLDGDLEKAQAELKGLRASNGDALKAAGLRAELCACQREWAAIISESDWKLLELGPSADRHRFMYWLALALEHSGRRREAEAKFKDLVAADASGPWGARARRHLTPTGAHPLEWWSNDLASTALIATTEADAAGETEALAVLDKVTERAVDYLLSRQRFDGAWEGSTNGYEQSPLAASQMDSAVIPRTALCVCALRAFAPQFKGERAKLIAAAIAQGAVYVRAAMLATYDNVWSVTYALHMELDFYPDLRGKERTDCAGRIAQHLLTVARIEQEGGGWTYAGSGRWNGRRHTFNTAPIVMLLVRAKALGIKIDEAMLKRGCAFLESQRVGKAAIFHYGPVMESVTSPQCLQSSSMRNPLCECALLEAGEAKGDGRITESIEFFFKYLDDVRRTCKTWEHYFEPSIMQDAYHYYFGTYYAALAMGHIENTTNRQGHARKLLVAVVRTQEIDGSFVDAQLTTGKNCSTALALLTIRQCAKLRENGEKRR